MKIVVLAGGLSPERDVSLSSGSLIANALLERGHQVLLLDLYYGVRSGEERQFRQGADAPRYHYAVPPEEPDLEALIAENGGRTAPIGPEVLELCRQADVAFLALHGGMGENGQLQAVLDAYGVRYTGSDYLGCGIAMDKDLSKVLLRAAGVPTPDWKTYPAGTANPETIEAEVGLPCAIKPVGCGSSVGVSLVYGRSELCVALDLAEKYRQNVLAEVMVKGREFSVGILGGKALPVIEIVPKEGFYDYKNKYQAGCTQELCPAPLTQEETAKVQALAERAHEALRLGSYSRVDFLLDEQGGFWCLEANNLPGMTPVSLLPQEAAAAGVDYGTLCESLAKMALEK